MSKPHESPSPETSDAAPEDAHGPVHSQASAGPDAHPHEHVPLPDDDHASHDAGQIPPAMASGRLGTLLEPILRQSCDDRLSEVSWFRTDWQRGGALTGYATYTDDRGDPRDVVVKLPVPPCERHWLAELQHADDVVPELFAHGDAVGGYDLAWVVMERLPHGPLSSAWQGGEFDLLIEALGRFYAATQDHPLQGEPKRYGWEGILERARESVRAKAVADPQRWSKALKKAQKKLDDWLKFWRARPIEQWCHGDLHLANAMSRTPAPQGPALLLDFALVRVGHWVEDGVYFEHLYWSRRQKLGGRKLCSMIAQQRKALGLPVDPDWPKYAEVKRALLAIATPANLHFDGDPRHVAAALEILEHAVG